jgi:hypothetical protein
MMNTVINTGKSNKILRFWNEDRSLSVMFVLLVVFIFVLVPALDRGRIGELIIKGTYTIMLCTAILSVAKNNRYVTVIGLFAIAAIIVNWVSDFEPTTTVLIIHNIASISFNLLFALVILKKTFKEGDITFQRIQGSIVVFLLAGLMYAYVFDAIYLYAGPGSFNNVSGIGLKEFLYFSFTSLTTMGYGDITPVHPLARSLANSEALIGQLYPAILIARLVSLEIESSSTKRKRSE